MTIREAYAKEAYAGNPKTWPQWLTEEEQEKILQAAKNGSNPKRDTYIIASMLYLGVTYQEATKISYRQALGDAIEKDKAFLHIPVEYKKIIRDMHEEGETTNVGERLTQCTQKEAETLVKQAFERAGLVTDDCFMRLKRTAAHLHYIKQWTDEYEIEKWFTEIKYIEDRRKDIYYSGRNEELYELLTIHLD